MGADRAHPGALRMNSSQFFGLPLISIGEVRADRVNGATEWILAENDDVYRKVVFRDGRLIGAMLLGDISGAGLFYRLYREGRDLREVVERGPDERGLREAWYAGRGGA